MEEVLAFLVDQVAPAFLDLQGDPEDPSDLVGQVGPVVLNESETQAGPAVPSVPVGQHYPVDRGAPLAHEGLDVSAFHDVRVNPEAVAFLVGALGGLEVLVVP